MTGRKSPHELAREAEAMLGEVQGVRHARLALGRQGEISEVHVVADSTRRGKELVRDIETVLKACFDLPVDHRRISVARVGEDELEPAPAVGSRRIRLAGVGVRIGEGAGAAQVDLRRDGMESSGETQGAALGGAWLRLVALATLDAVTRFLPAGIGLSLGTVSRGHLGQRDVILVGVDYAGDREMRELVGCAYLGEDVQRSVAQATLDAVNRVLGKHDFRAEALTILEPPL